MERKERLRKAIDYLRMNGVISSDKEVASRMHADPSNVSRAVSTSPTDKFLRRFNTAFGDIFSIGWLMNEEGEMLKTETKEEEPRPSMDVTVDKDTLLKLLMHSMKINEQFSEELAELRQRIRKLEEEKEEGKKDDAKLSPSTSANNQQDKNKVS